MSHLPNPERSCAAPTPPGNFDGLARLYRWMELLTFGPLLARCRTAFLQDCATCKRALVLGDGDGRFTAQLLRANPVIEIDAVDASPAMLDALMRHAAPHRERVCVFCADIRAWRPANPPYDLVVTHFFLDCLLTEEVSSMAAALHEAVSGNALWIVSDFAVSKGWFGRLVGEPLVWFLYWAFGVLTGLSASELPDHAAALRQAGWFLSRRQARLGGLLISEIWQREGGPAPRSRMLQIC